MSSFTEIADRVYVLRYPVLDVNTTLIVGDGAALVVDTLASAVQGAELRDAIRRVTAEPLTIVNTHHHFDHVFGNATLRGDTPGCPIWGHEYAARQLTERTPHELPLLYAEWVDAEPTLAAELADVKIIPPDHTVRTAATLDIGGREVRLEHTGRGHTAGDLVVRVPDADVLVAGDLIEEGAEPSFGDSYPLDWPDTLAAVLPWCTGPVVPGHGAVVDRDYAAAQHGLLSRVDWAIREGDADGQPADKVAEALRLAYRTALVAVRRGYAQLAGLD